MCANLKKIAKCAVGGKMLGITALGNQNVELVFFYKPAATDRISLRQSK